MRHHSLWRFGWMCALSFAWSFAVHGLSWSQTAPSEEAPSDAEVQPVEPESDAAADGVPSGPTPATADVPDAATPPPAVPEARSPKTFQPSLPIGLTTPGEKSAWRAGQLINEGQFAAAEAKASLAQTQAGGMAPGWYQMARLRHRQARMSEAEMSVTRAIEADGAYVPAQYFRVRLFALEGRSQEAVSGLKRAVAAHPEAYGLQLCLAEAYVASEQYEAGIRTARTVLKRAETSVAAMKILARAYAGSGNSATAEAILKRALEISPDAEAMVFLAGILLERRDLTGARTRLEAALQKVPNHVEALNSLGVIYVEVRNWEAAIEVFERALGSAPSFAVIWLNIGSAHRGTSNFREAEAAWKHVLELDSGMAEAWYNLGILYLENLWDGQKKLTQLERSIDAFNQYKSGSLGAETRSVDPYIEEAKVLIKQEKERIAEELKSAQEIDEELSDDDGEQADEGDLPDSDDAVGGEGSEDDASDNSDHRDAPDDSVLPEGELEDAQDQEEGEEQNE